MSYKFVVVEYPLIDKVGGKTYTDKYAGLGIRDEDNGIIYPLPITKFLEEGYRNQRISTQKNAAEAIKRFLNYCREAIIESEFDQDFQDFSILKEQGLQGLKLVHGSFYITHLSYRCKYEGLDQKYAKKDIRYLNKFYFFLQKEGLIEKQFESLYKDVKVITRSGEKKLIKKLVEVDIFKGIGTVYPPQETKKELAKRKNKLKDFGKNRYQLVKEFIEVAVYTEPDIVIGIYLQFFGGLRRGEVVNVLRDGLMETEDGYIVDVDDYRDILFPNKKSTDNEQVKQPRYQGLFWHKSMDYAYKQHLKWLDSLKKKGKLKNKQALLINERTGLPMTGSTYADKFKRVKEVYLEKLCREARGKDYDFLNPKPWSTHIGRGCFTNFCLDVGMKIGEVAVIRGDSSVHSVLDYIEEKVAVQTLKKAMEHIQQAFEGNGNDENGNLKKFESRLNSQYSTKWSNKYEN
ncbi:hypothetical protein [Peribacillus frigoritolerans]|uniref:hypothetical protein n=1 Tax=Peribacillus frigoritolerans TaxID=450367 RepID=UPI00223117AE|nr:hypothetical protein [Peribacillus frigoritolerans]UZD44903.1 hypothetical protein OMJ04_14700 [Peribacillus frigoritolerans]